MPICEELDFELLPDCEEADFEPLPECEELDFEVPVPARFASWLQPPGSPLEPPELPGFPECASRIGILEVWPELLVEVELEFLSRESDLFFISPLQCRLRAAWSGMRPLKDAVVPGNGMQTSE